MTYVPPVPFDYDELVTGLSAVLDVCCSVPGAVLGGTTQQADSSFYFPSSDPADGITLAKITHNIISVNGLGWDEWRTGYDPTAVIAGDTYVPDPTHPDKRLGGVVYSSEGNRKITVSIKCECWDMSQSGAIKYIERIRARINMPSFCDALRALRVAQNDLSATRTLTYVDDTDHSVSVAQFDLVLNAADAAVDQPITTIVKVIRPIRKP